MTPDPILEIRDASRRYGDRAIVDAASLTIDPGGIACLLGPSGCGKSTLLRMVAGLEPIDDGEIRIHGITMSQKGLMVAPEDRGVGLVFQDNALFPHLDVTANIGFGLARMAAPARHERVTALLTRFQIDHLAAAWPHTLSGGEQQRVAIARALARNPSLLLLDEPFSGLDGHLRVQVRQSLLADLRESGATVLVVTHDPEEAMLIADQLILMSAGRIVQTGSPAECYRTPASREAARLLGDILIFPARVANGVADTPFGIVAAPALSDGPAEALVRPDMLRLADDGLQAEIVALRFAGATTLAELKCANQSISLRVPNASFDLGMPVALQVDPASISIQGFDDNGR